MKLNHIKEKINLPPDPDLMGSSQTQTTSFQQVSLKCAALSLCNLGYKQTEKKTLGEPPTNVR